MPSPAELEQTGQSRAGRPTRPWCRRAESETSIRSGRTAARASAPTPDVAPPAPPAAGHAETHRHRRSDPGTRAVPLPCADPPSPTASHPEIRHDHRKLLVLGLSRRRTSAPNQAKVRPATGPAITRGVPARGAADHESWLWRLRDRRGWSSPRAAGRARSRHAGWLATPPRCARPPPPPSPVQRCLHGLGLCLPDRGPYGLRLKAAEHTREIAARCWA